MWGDGYIERIRGNFPRRFIPAMFVKPLPVIFIIRLVPDVHANRKAD